MFYLIVFRLTIYLCMIDINRLPLVRPRSRGLMKALRLTKTGVPSSQIHWLPTLDIPRKNFPLDKFLLETNWLSCIDVKSDLGMIRLANGFMPLQV